VVSRDPFVAVGSRALIDFLFLSILDRSGSCHASLEGLALFDSCYVLIGKGFANFLILIFFYM